MDFPSIFAEVRVILNLLVLALEHDFISCSIARRFSDCKSGGGQPLQLMSVQFVIVLQTVSLELLNIYLRMIWSPG